MAQIGKFLAFVSLLALLSCGSNINDKNNAYKKIHLRQALTFPPNLIKQSDDELINQSLLDYNQNKITQNKYTVLPSSNSINFKRDGQQRWLQSKQSADKLWPKINSFLADIIGTAVAVDNKPAGLITTEWFEVQEDTALENLLIPKESKLRLHFRLEKHNNLVEIYCNHQFEDQTIKNKPNLDAEILALLMAYLGATEAEVKKQKERKYPTSDRAILKTEGKITKIEVKAAFAQTWRRVGNAVNSLGIKITDINRTEGKYYIAYADPSENQDSYFVSESDLINYELTINELDNGNSLVTLLDQNQKPSTTNSIMKILYLQLK